MLDGWGGAGDLKFMFNCNQIDILMGWWDEIEVKCESGAGTAICIIDLGLRVPKSRGYSS